MPQLICSLTDCGCLHVLWWKVRLFRESLLESMAAEPDARLARRFRMFVEHQLIPALSELAELLHESGSLLEWPTTAEMVELFPYMLTSSSRELLMFQLQTHTQAWCALCEALRGAFHVDTRVAAKGRSCGVARHRIRACEPLCVDNIAGHRSSKTGRKITSSSISRG